GDGSVFNQATVASDPDGTRNDRTSPLPTSITPATTDRACTSSPTQLPSLITGASRNSGSTAGPLPTATRANLRARRRALHTVWPSGLLPRPSPEIDFAADAARAGVTGVAEVGVGRNRIRAMSTGRILI